MNTKVNVQLLRTFGYGETLHFGSLFVRKCRKWTRISDNLWAEWNEEDITIIPSSSLIGVTSNHFHRAEECPRDD